MKKLKGGIESIIAVIILAGIVIALIIAVVLPIANKTRDVGSAGKGNMEELTKKISGK